MVPTRLAPGRGWSLFALALVAAATIAADQATKAIVRSALALGESVDAVGPFSVHHVRNSGILGGHLQGSAPPIAVVTTVALAGLAIYLARRERLRPLAVAGFGLLLGGGLGNLVDRIRLGYVTDFLDRGHGGAFNLADVAILLGLVAVLAASARERRAPRPGLEPRPETPPGC